MFQSCIQDKTHKIFQDNLYLETENISRNNTLYKKINSIFLTFLSRKNVYIFVCVHIHICLYWLMFFKHLKMAMLSTLLPSRILDDYNFVCVYTKNSYTIFINSNPLTV